MLFAVTFFLSRYLREKTHSRPESRGGFRQHVETIKAPCLIFLIIVGGWWYWECQLFSLFACSGSGFFGLAASGGGRVGGCSTGLMVESEVLGISVVAEGAWVFTGGGGSLGSDAGFGLVSAEGSSLTGSGGVSPD